MEEAIIVIIIIFIIIGFLLCAISTSYIEDASKPKWRIKEVQKVNREGNVLLSLFFVQERTKYRWKTHTYREGKETNKGIFITNKKIRAFPSIEAAKNYIKHCTKVAYYNDVLLPILVYIKETNKPEVIYYCPRYFFLISGRKYYYIYGSYTDCTSLIKEENATKVVNSINFFHNPNENVQ